MDSKRKRLYSRVVKKLIVLRPKWNKSNPTLPEEMEEATWILGEECKKLMKHCPEVYIKSVKVAQEFLLTNGKKSVN